MGYVGTTLVVESTIKQNFKEASIRVDYTDIEIVHGDIKITISVDGKRHWYIVAERKLQGEEEETLIISGRSIYYKLKSIDQKLVIDYEFTSPNAEDPVECTSEEALVDFIKQVFNGKSLLESAVEYLPLDP